jgi:hypothetical protein
MGGLDYSTEQLKRWLDEAVKKHQRLSDQYSGVRPGWVSMDLCDLWMDIDQYQKELAERS